MEEVKISNGYEPFEYDEIRKNNHSKKYHEKIRKRREADATDLPGHRGRLKIIEGIEWHEELLDVHSEAFLLLENELLTMVCTILLNVWYYF